MTTKNIVKLIACIVLPMVAGGVSGFITKDAITGWYATLTKPSFNPPNFIFGPVWTTLYILMGVSLYLVLNTPPDSRRRLAIGIFGTQLILNFFWSIIFFSLQHLGFALFEIAALWLAIITMIITFYSIKPVAAYLQIPYLLWVSFASVLNYSLFHLN